MVKKFRVDLVPKALAPSPHLKKKVSAYVRWEYKSIQLREKIDFLNLINRQLFIVIQINGRIDFEGENLLFFKKLMFEKKNQHHYATEAFFNEIFFFFRIVATYFLNF